MKTLKVLLAAQFKADLLLTGYLFASTSIFLDSQIGSS